MALRRIVFHISCRPSPHFLHIHPLYFKYANLEIEKIQWEMDEGLKM